MKRKSICFLLVTICLAGCQTNYNGNDGIEYIEYEDGYYIPSESDVCSDNALPCAQVIKYSAPNGNDLLLETPKNTIHITATPGRKYQYRVWAGQDNYNRAPDLILD